jgi:hypothetical protein
MDDSSTNSFLAPSTNWTDGMGPGHVVKVSLEPADEVPPFEYFVVGLTSDLDSYDMATFRMQREGGSNSADHALRRNLFTLVGAITVAGGHIESEMKRILIRAEENRGANFVDVDETWSGLEKRLAAVAAGDGPLAAEIGEALDWARRRRIKKIRDDAVHSTWELWEIGSAKRSRFRRRKDGEMIHGQIETFMSHVPRMFEYVSRLAQIANWPTAILPPLPDLVPQAIVVMRLETDVGSSTAPPDVPKDLA